jgi:hypothetical protein
LFEYIFFVQKEFLFLTLPLLLRVLFLHVQLLR